MTLEAQGRRALVTFVPQLLILTKCSGPLAPEVLAVLQRLALEASGKQALMAFETDVQVGVGAQEEELRCVSCAAPEPLGPPGRC